MLDASAKLPQGLLSSDAYDLGNYDECLEINLRRNQDEKVLGKYCLAKFSISPAKCRLKSRNVFGNSKVSTFEDLIVNLRLSSFEATNWYGKKIAES